MKKNIKLVAAFSVFCLTMLSLMTISCDKEKSLGKAENTVFSKSNEPRSGLIPILTVETGKKVGDIGLKRKKCRGYKGTCYLWFGGFFLIEDTHFEREFPTNLFSNPESTSYQSENVAGAHIAHVVKDSLDILYDFSCVDEIDARTWINDIKEGATAINDTIPLDNKELLVSLGLDRNVASPSGRYTIKASNLKSSQFFVRVPIIDIK